MRDVQQVFYDRMKELYLESKERAEQFKKLIVMVCGAGKTYLAYCIFKWIYHDDKSMNKNLFVM